MNGVKAGSQMETDRPPFHLGQSMSGFLGSTRVMKKMDLGTVSEIK